MHANGHLTIEALRQAVQIVRHVFQFLTNCRALMRLFGTAVRELGNLGDLPADIFRHMALLLRRRGHLLTHAGDTADGFADAIQRGAHGLHTLNTLLGNRLALACRYYRPLSASTQ